MFKYELTIYGDFVNLSNMSQEPDLKRDAILAAAFAQFSQYGFRKTSMEDIAKATGISRASLYTRFDNKEDIFRAACFAINEQTLNEAARLLKGSKGKPSLRVRVTQALLARYGPLLEIAHSPHGAEIYDENNRLCGALAVESAAQLHEMLTKALRAGDRAGEINLKARGLSASAAAELVQLGAAGLKQGTPDVATFEKRLNSFVEIFFAGLTPN